MILALSTAWNFQRHRSGKEMLEEIVNLGFHWTELHQGLSPFLISEIVEFVEKGRIRISNLRNYCFLPLNRFKFHGPQFTARGEGERKSAVHLTLQTIDYALQFGAGYVVLDCGTLGSTKSHPSLQELASRGKLYTKEFAHAKIQKIMRREKESPILIQRVIDCLRIVGDYASARGIRLGIENQATYDGFPSEREFPFLLEELNHPAFGYWHNFGHAQIKQHLTLLDHQQWLERIGSRAIGCSVDDIQDLDSQHLPPFTGVIAYEKLIPLLPENNICVLDLRGCNDNALILNSVERLKKYVANLVNHKN